MERRPPAFSQRSCVARLWYASLHSTGCAFWPVTHRTTAPTACCTRSPSRSRTRSPQNPFPASARSFPASNQARSNASAWRRLRTLTYPCLKGVNSILHVRPYRQLNAYSCGRRMRYGASQDGAPSPPSAAFPKPGGRRAQARKRIDIVSSKGVGFQEAYLIILI